MNEYREAIYTTMFNALRHDARRKILFLLSRGDRSFTDLYETLGITSSYLTYHLEALDGLIRKSHSAYTLSSNGRTAVDIMNKVERPHRPTSMQINMLYGEGNLSKPLLGLLLIALLIVTGLYMNLQRTYASQLNTLEEKDSVIASLNTELSTKKDLSGLELICRILGARITSFYTLSYTYGSKQNLRAIEKNSALVFYAPEDGLTLKIELLCYLPEGAYLPVTVQEGIAPEYEMRPQIVSEEVASHVHKEYQSPVIASWNVTNADQELLVSLDAMGWYTISLTGQIRVSRQDGAYVDLGWLDHDLWADTEPAKMWANCQLLKNGEATLFVIDMR